MKTRILGVVLTLAVLVCSLAVGAVSVSAETNVTVTVASVAGQKGDIIEVPVSISAGSYMVNGDMHIYFDTTKLKLDKTYYEVPDFDGETDCYQVSSTLFNSSWWFAGNEKTPGDFYFAAITPSNTGISAGGEMFRLAFEIIADNFTTTQITFSASPFRGNNGSGAIGDDGYPVDYSLTYTAVAGVVTYGATTQTTTTTQPLPQASGDLNSDGAIDMWDSFTMYAGVNGSSVLTDAERAAADINGDGTVDMWDCFELYAIVSGAA